MRLLDLIPDLAPLDIARKNERALVHELHAKATREAERLEQDILAKTPTNVLVREILRRFGYSSAPT